MPLAQTFSLKRASLRAGIGRRELSPLPAHRRAAPAAFIVMDAPPPHEDVRPFVRHRALHQGGGPACAARCWRRRGAGLPAAERPRQHAVPRGAARRRRRAEADALMREAIAALVQWQSGVPMRAALPPYDDALLRRELALFPDWCVQREFGITWTDEQHASVAAPVRPAGAQRAGAAARGGASRLDAAQPDAVASPTPASSTSRTRCAARSPTTWRRCCATPSSRGTKSARSTGRCAGGQRARHAGARRPRVRRRLRRVLARAGMDGAAAPPEGAGHLLPPEAPRRQAALQPPTCRASSPTPCSVALRYRPLAPLLPLIEPLSRQQAVRAG